MQHRHLNESRRQKAVSLAPLARPPATNHLLHLPLAVSAAVSAAHLCRERFARQVKCLSPPSLPSPSAIRSYSRWRFRSFKDFMHCRHRRAALPVLVDRLNMPPAARCGCECVNTCRDLGSGWAARARLPSWLLPYSEVAKSIPLKSISTVVNRDGDLHKPLSPDASAVQRPYHGV